MRGISEAVDAKQYWSTTDTQGKEYGSRPPFYASALVHVIRRLAPRTILEMGCNTGRNLDLLRHTLPADVSVRGFDINRRSVEYGSDRWGLDLDVADETYLASQRAGSVDVVFTVSVLDHLPEVETVLRDLSRITRGYYLALEPYPEADLRYLDVFKADGQVPAMVTTGTPHSYLHPYHRLTPEAGLRAVLDVPMPPYAKNWGPLYRLTVWAKPDAPAALVPWQQLRDELMFAAVTQSI